MVIILLAFSNHHTNTSQDIADVMIITLFYLLMPGKYIGTTIDYAMFCLCDLQLWIGNLAIDIMTPPIEQLLASTSMSLVFHNSKKWGTRRVGKPCIQRCHAFLPCRGFSTTRYQSAGTKCSNR
jgi:hypothetical protein